MHDSAPDTGVTKSARGMGAREWRWWGAGLSAVAVFLIAVRWFAAGLAFLAAGLGCEGWARWKARP